MWIYEDAGLDMCGFQVGCVSINLRFYLTLKHYGTNQPEFILKAYQTMNYLLFNKFKYLSATMVNNMVRVS